MSIWIPDDLHWLPNCSPLNNSFAGFIPDISIITLSGLIQSKSIEFFKKFPLKDGDGIPRNNRPAAYESYKAHLLLDWEKDKEFKRLKIDSIDNIIDNNKDSQHKKKVTKSGYI